MSTIADAFLSDLWCHHFENWLEWWKLNSQPAVHFFGSSHHLIFLKNAWQKPMTPSSAVLLVDGSLSLWKTQHRQSQPSSRPSPNAEVLAKLRIGSRLHSWCRSWWSRQRKARFHDNHLPSKLGSLTAWHFAMSVGASLVVLASNISNIFVPFHTIKSQHCTQSIPKPHPNKYSNHFWFVTHLLGSQTATFRNLNYITSKDMQRPSPRGLRWFASSKEVGETVLRCLTVSDGCKLIYHPFTVSVSCKAEVQKTGHAWRRCCLHWFHTLLSNHRGEAGRTQSCEVDALWM